ncbi:MAG TPA: hypothetical protein VK157_15390, partial [Phycisphaerales bacterium]|nr:hypothetical protein [Phycisphaerales bacterium]
MASRQMTFVVACSALFAGSAMGTQVVLTAPVTITPTTTAISPTLGGPAVPLAQAEIIVSGTTLTVTGRHTIQSLTLLGGARVTHPARVETNYAPGDLVRGMYLIVTGDVTIGAGGLIDVDGQGFDGSSGT